MSFGFSHRFSVDAFERPVVPSVPSMAAAAQAYSAGDHAEAKRRCLSIIEHDSRHFDALHLLGVVCLDGGEYADALPYLARALREHADDARVHYHIGTAWLGLKQYERAEAALRRALLLDPKDANVLNNLGNVLGGTGRHDEAIASYRQALSIKPALTPARFNLGRSLAALDRLEEAVVNFRETLAGMSADTDPDRWTDVHVSLGQALVGLGRHDEGIAACRAIAESRPQIAAWNESLILLQLGRYDEGWPKYESRWDVTPLLSSPLVFDTGLDSIPARVPYLLAPPERLAAWRRRLGSGSRRRVGLAWWGSQHIPGRSVHPELLLPLLSMPGIEFHSLQKDVPAAHREGLSGRPIVDHAAELNDYADTAALISLLDQVITIDTSVAQLAGALGKPVWIMLQHSADWRWLLDRYNSPWYPTARLFCQRRAEIWQDVVADVTQALASADGDSVAIVGIGGNHARLAATE